MSTRIIKNDEENETEKRRLQMNGLKKLNMAKDFYPKELRRPALGELGNRALTRAAMKENTAIKPDYTHVKPRVDCHRNYKNEREKQLDLNMQMQKKLGSLRRNYTGTKPVAEVKARCENIEPPKIRIQRPSDETKGKKQAVVSAKLNPTVMNLATPNQIKSHSQNLLRHIDNIDEENGNLFLVNDYANDVYTYLFELENENIVHLKYLEKHEEITPTMRTILIDWLSETHTQFQLVLETYFLTVALVDAYLQMHPETKRKNLQLVGCTAMFIAAKYEEVYAPDIKEFVYITDKTYSERQICEMEMSILKSVNFRLGQPLSIQFLRRFSKAGNADGLQHLMGKYFIELVSIEYSMAHLKKSLVAAASLYLATHIHQQETSFNNSIWTSTLEYYSTYTPADLNPVALQIIKLIKNAPKSSKNKYHAIYSKYARSKNEEISKKLLDSKTKIILDSLQDQHC